MAKTRRAPLAQEEGRGGAGPGWGKRALLLSSGFGHADWELGLQVSPWPPAAGGAQPRSSGGPSAGGSGHWVPWRRGPYPGSRPLSRWLLWGWWRLPRAAVGPAPSRCLPVRRPCPLAGRREQRGGAVGAERRCPALIAAEGLVVAWGTVEEAVVPGPAEATRKSGPGAAPVSSAERPRPISVGVSMARIVLSTF